eukprot:jgi/Mesen1/1735/ME000139S00969
MATLIGRSPSSVASCVISLASGKDLVSKKTSASSIHFRKNFFSGQKLKMPGGIGESVSKMGESVRSTVAQASNDENGGSNGGILGDAAHKVGETVKNLSGTAGQYIQSRKGTHGKPLYTTSAGTPVSNDDNSLVVGEQGTISLEDFHFFDKNQHFNRERVPERVVHAKGMGAHGYFELTHDVSDICKASIFSSVGKRTPAFARFSSVAGERGYTDAARDIRGFSWKFYTEDGIWDMVGNNTPVFWVRDPIKFPDLIHSQKRNPQSNLRDPNAYWDFISLVPETMHQTLITFSPRGVPKTFRHMHGYGSHTFKWVNKNDEPVYVKFHFHSDQGVQTLSSEEAKELSGIDPDAATRDLHENIAEGKYPSWTFFVQVMPVEDADRYKWDPFDLTKVWLKSDYPLRQVGKLVLDKNVKNYFAEVEQAAFSPAHMPPGIEPSPDRILQSRMFSYNDAARYRAGTNVDQIPINRCPVAVQNYQRDGAMNVTDNGGDVPNYYPNSFTEVMPTLPVPDPGQPDVTPYRHPGGVVGRYMPQRWKDQDDYEQPRMLWNLFSDSDKETTIQNIAAHMSKAKDMIKQRQLGNFAKVDPELARRVEAAMGEEIKSSKPYSLIA